MAGERHLEGVLAAAGGGTGVPGLLGLLLAMEACLPVPIPSDLVMPLLGERVSAGALPLWVAVLLLELVALAGTAALFLAARGPGRALLTRLGPRLGLTGPRLALATESLGGERSPSPGAGRGVVHRVTETGRCLQDRVGRDAERPAEGSGRALPVRWTALHVQAGVLRGARASPPRLVGAVAPVVPG
jgi:hypothetical protein